MNKKIFFLITIIILLFTGCVNIEVNQKIKRNGNIDLSIIFKSTNSFILESITQDFEINPDIENKAFFEKTENSVIFKFKNINPRKESFFKKVDDDDTPLLDQDNYNFKKEFKFPYYYFIYEIGEQKNDTIDEDLQKLGNLFDNMMKINFNIEVFGTIIETNGNQINKNKVSFESTLTSEDYYYIKFRDFFLFTWIGSLF